MYTLERDWLPSEGSVLCPNAKSKQGSNTARITTAQKTTPELAIFLAE
jgi:hypothetical protein